MKSGKAKERLDKILANNGFGTRKEVRHFIRAKIVTVNGTLVTDPDAPVSLENDEICINGEKIQLKRNLYLMMNKAKDYVCSNRGGFHATVFELLKEDAHRKYLGGELHIVGRLDVDTEGLLILTTDGALTHRLTSPKWECPKTYLVYLRDKVNAEQQKEYTEKLAKGVHIAPEGSEPEADCLPAELEWFKETDYTDENKAVPNAACAITVYEGKFHEVKRLFAALGNEVVYLKRLSINRLHLDENLAPGEYRELSPDEIKLLDVEEEND